MPVDVRMEAFNPLIPGDADLSGIPVAVLRFVLTNKTAEPSAPRYAEASKTLSEQMAR